MYLCSKSEAGAKLVIISKLSTMTCAELIEINKKLMELMSKLDIKTSDHKFVTLYEEYLAMKKECLKYWYIITHLSEKYKISESTIKRLIRKFSKEVNL